MELNKDPEWLRKMAEQENGVDVSVGGWMASDLRSSKPWLVWSYNPGPDGGWEIVEGYYTKEDATAGAKNYHEKMVAKEKDRFQRYKARSSVEMLFTFYGGVMVTPGSVFSTTFSLKECE